MNNFIGKDNFVWWTGVVEKRDDPLGLGRCRVRIFGWHTDDLNAIPTDQLPWAIPVNSPNNSQSFEAPREGDFVVGFFGDGPSAQMPIMTGVFPGIQATAPNRNKGFSPQNDPKKGPQLPSGVKANEVGQPSTPPLARGVVENTGVAKTNADVVHVCDITGNIRYSIAWISLKIGQAIRAIRAALAALWAGASGSPFVDEVRAVIKAIKAKIKQAQKFIKDMAEKLKVIKDVIKQLQDLVKYIASLPAKLARLFKQCLAEATASIKDAIKNAESIVNSSSVAEANTIIVTAQSELANTANT